MILASVDAMIAADSAKGYNSFMVAVDDAQQMRTYGVDPVADPADGKQNKEAIDAICIRYPQAMLVLLGGADIIPFQKLTDPDTKKDILSDLPYACEAAFSRDILSFIEPTRMITRLPDVTGKPSYVEESARVAKFARVIIDAARRDTRPAGDYTQPFAVSAEDWQISKLPLVQALYGSKAELASYPPDGGSWSQEQYNRLHHYFALYGDNDRQEWYADAALSTPAYWFEDGQAYLGEDLLLLSQVSCGAQLTPSREASRDTHTYSSYPIANVYLENGAGAFLGSTCPVSNLPDNPSNTLLRIFLSTLHQGATLGKALREARLGVRNLKNPPDAEALRTLAGYVVYGDVSYQPIDPK